MELFIRVLYSVEATCYSVLTARSWQLTEFKVRMAKLYRMKEMHQSCFYSSVRLEDRSKQKLMDIFDELLNPERDDTK